jgi:class 3 adenylate cyclase/tetratricopeptide (TPR) repeat protein
LLPAANQERISQVMTEREFCPACGADNAAGSRFCQSCGAALVTDAAGGPKARKVVTILFSDVAGWTSLGEELDPESLRQLMTSYFNEMKDIIDRHGGTTEKFIGDAVMAVFGVPIAHEDDAYRALRAAAEMREALDRLNEEFEREWGLRVLTRSGVNTGEVVAGRSESGQTFVTGDAVNLASRLEEAADPGEIVIGDATYRLAKDAVKADLLPPLTVKGKPEPITAWRLVDVTPAVPPWARQLDSPLIGRQRELTLLESAYRQAVDNRECQLVTIMAAAGGGKSRLTGELLARVGSGAKLLAGRCLPYGDGITFWPIVEVLQDAASISEFASPDECCRNIMSLLPPGPDAAVIRDRLVALMGHGDVTPGVHETFWSVRKLLEALAAREPLVIALDDIHWAEPTLLDLIEYLADWLRGVPVLVVCMARPDLLELRGAWMSDKTNAAVVSLPPLNDTETAGLVSNLLNGGELAEDAWERIARAAEGNPLFVEETLRMLVDDGLLERRNGRWAVTGDLSRLAIPPTIHALLTARLDRLPKEEREVIERASVVGRVFWWDAVSALSHEEERPHIGALLQSLKRKDLVEPERSDVGDEDAFRFTHILIVDAAYRGIPKSSRADLHAQFADWLEMKSRDRGNEYEEIVGYHLEQAYYARADLGQKHERTRALGARAAITLASAGRRAFARGDMPAAVNLLSRAVALRADDDPARLELLPDLAFALLETGDFSRVQEVIAETSEAAAPDDRQLQGRLLVLRLWVQLFTDPEGWAEDARRGAAEAIAMFENMGDQRGLAKAWALLGLFHLTMCEFGAADEAWEKAAGHAEAADDDRERLEALSWIPLVVWGSPTPVEQAIRRCDAVYSRASGDRKAMSTALFTRAKFEAMRGRFSEARELVEKARAMLEEVALTVWMAGPFTQMAAWVELLADEPESAERQLRWGVETLREIGEFAWLPTVVGILAEAVYAQGRFDEVADVLMTGEEAAGSDDAYSQGLLRSVGAKSLARRGQIDDAERLAREAVKILEPTDFLFLQAFARASLGEVLMLAQRAEEAEHVLTEGIRLAETKGFDVGAQRARTLLGLVTPR